MMNIKNTLIRFFGLKGSWSWAKRQMKKGKIIRAKHWTGSMKIKIDHPSNPILLATWDRSHPYKWERCPHSLNDENAIDYETI